MGRVRSPAHTLDSGAGESGQTKIFKLLKKREFPYDLAHSQSEYSAVWLAQLLWEQWVGGSNPSAPISSQAVRLSA